MKKLFLISALVVFLTACRNNGKSPGQKLDTLIQQVDTTAEQFWDSTKSKTRAVTEKIRDRFDKTDSTTKK